MEIIAVNIHSFGDGCVAKVDIDIEGGVIIKYIKILESKAGIYVKWPQSIQFTNHDTKKELSNRILATYVINHCEDTCSEEKK
jgi:DNA-binding cell septation regulator SpoVG